MISEREVSSEPSASCLVLSCFADGNDRERDCTCRMWLEKSADH